MCLSEGGFRGRGIGESWATFLGLFLGGGGLIFSPFPSSFNFPLLPLFVPYYLTQGLHQRPLEIATKNSVFSPEIANVRNIVDRVFFFRQIAVRAWSERALR